MSIVRDKICSLAVGILYEGGRVRLDAPSFAVYAVRTLHAADDRLVWTEVLMKKKDQSFYTWQEVKQEDRLQLAKNLAEARETDHMFEEFEESAPRTKRRQVIVQEAPHVSEPKS